MSRQTEAAEPHGDRKTKAQHTAGPVRQAPDGPGDGPQNSPAASPLNGQFHLPSFVAVQSSFSPSPSATLSLSVAFAGFARDPQSDEHLQTPDGEEEAAGSAAESLRAAVVPFVRYVQRVLHRSSTGSCRQ